MAKPALRIVCVHAMNGRAMFVRLSHGDKFLLSKKPVVAVIGGQQYEVREGRKEIEEFIRDA